jgi:hypothetical protein
MVDEPPDWIPRSNQDLLTLPDDQLAAWVWTWWMGIGMEGKGIPLDNFSPRLEEIIRHETLGLDTDNEADAGLEKVMKLLALANGAAHAKARTKVIVARNYMRRAVKMLRELMERRDADRYMFTQFAISRLKQRERASKPREDELNRVIRQIAEKRLDISTPEVLHRLQSRSLQGNEVIREVTETEIHVIPRKGGPDKKIKITALSDRLSRVKRKIRQSRQRG